LKIFRMLITLPWNKMSTIPFIRILKKNEFFQIYEKRERVNKKFVLSEEKGRICLFPRKPDKWGLYLTRVVWTWRQIVISAWHRVRTLLPCSLQHSFSGDGNWVHPLQCTEEHNSRPEYVSNVLRWGPQRGWKFASLP
jgi:hypothetical protein